MSEEKRVRKTRYERGREDALRDCLLVVSAMTDAWPNQPGDTFACMIGSHAEVNDLIGQVKRFAKKVGATRPKNVEAAA